MTELSLAILDSDFGDSDFGDSDFGDSDIGDSDIGDSDIGSGEPHAIDTQVSMKSSVDEEHGRVVNAIGTRTP